MIDATIRPTPSRQFLNTVFTCPHCGKTANFFNSPPGECYNCDRPLPNLKKLEEMQNYRIMYHMYGDK